MSVKYNYEDIYKNLESRGYYLDISKEDFKGVTVSDLIAHDKDGYKYKLIYNQILRGQESVKFHKSNPFVIDNINLYLKNNNVHFKCISCASEYLDKNSELKFKCYLCGQITTSTWDRINRNDNPSRNHIVCNNCDKSNESLHASVLKQIFLHEYPDTIVEDKSFRNPKTKKICPTDIVNHRLKIAIEIQSQWHDFEDIKLKDKMKKEYWIKKGHLFYDPNIRNYSILEMCNLFFDIKELPDYIDYNYGKCINAKKVQDLLNEGYTAKEVSKILNINTHTIYDAVASGKIEYPDNYIRGDYTPIIKFDIDWNIIEEYKTIKEASEKNNIRAGSLSSALNCGRNYFHGYNWMHKRDYIKHIS